MWFDPLSQQQPDDFYLTDFQPPPRWFLPEDPPMSIEPLSWGACLRLLGDVFIELALLLLKQDDLPTPSTKQLTLRELRAYPLHQPDETSFSAN
jgi:hypothetical protein